MSQQEAAPASPSIRRGTLQSVKGCLLPFFLLRATCSVKALGTSSGPGPRSWGEMPLQEHRTLLTPVTEPNPSPQSTSGFGSRSTDRCVPSNSPAGQGRFLS